MNDFESIERAVADIKAGKAVVVVFIGLFAAASPETYGKASWRCCRDPGGTASARSSTRWPERCARGWWANWRPWS